MSPLAATAERLPGAAADDPATELAQLQRQLNALKSDLPAEPQFNRRLGESPGLSQAKSARLRQLDSDMVDFVVAHPEWVSNNLSGWYRAYRETSRLETFRNFQPDPAAAVAHAKDKLTRLDGVRDHFPIHLQQQLLIDPTNLLLRELHEHDVGAVIELAGFVEQLLEPCLMDIPELRYRWFQVKAERGSHVIRTHPDAGDEAWQATMLEWWREFLHDEIVPVRLKENEIIRLAISLHTVGRSDEGLTWLRWLEARPDYDAWNSMSWLSHAFFASWIGLGDRESGQAYFDRIQQLADQGDVRPGNDLLRAVTSSYYSQLRKSDVQHRADARQGADARFERHFPDAVRRPVPDIR